MARPLAMLIAVRLVGCLYLLLALLVLPSLVYNALVIPAALRERSAQSLAALTLIGGEFLVFLVAVLAGYGLLRLRSWARALGVALNVLAIVPSAIGVLSHPRAAWDDVPVFGRIIEGLILLVAVGVSALLLRADLDALRRADGGPPSTA